jgi:hypothetical protein
MNARYEPTSNSVRAIAATIAVATVLALFEFVTDLGAPGAEMLAQARAVQQQVAKAAPSPAPVG